MLFPPDALLPPDAPNPSATPVLPGATVSVLLYPGMSAFETGIVTEVFGLPRPEFGRPWYRLTVCAPIDAPVPMIGGATITTPFGLDEFAAAGTVIVPGVADVHRDPPDAVLDALRAASARGARILSICSGAFALAAAGLLDGRRATTHWRYAELLQRRFPAVHVDPGVLYLADGDVWTSAGSAAGLDLCLHVIRADHGAAIANAVARRLVVQPHRDGGQAQYIEAPMPTRRAAADAARAAGGAAGGDDPGDDLGDDRIARSVDWALTHLAEPLTVDTLARQAHMSARTYLRHFTRTTGTSPIRWLIRQRVQASLALLESTDTPIERIAAAVGFDTAVTYRHHFANTMRTSPSAYRHAFRTRTPQV